MKLSDQAVAAIMMALQKCIMEETDITDLLKGMDFQMGENEQLVALNPPVVNTTNYFNDYLPDETKGTVGSD